MVKVMNENMTRGKDWAQITRLAQSVSAVKRRQAVESLEFVLYQPEATMLLKQLLSDNSAPIRKAAAKLLGKFSLKSELEQKLVFKTAKSRDSTVRKTAIECLGNFGGSSDTKRIRTILLTQLDHKSAEIRQTAINALVKIAISEPKVLKAIADRLWDRNIGVRMAAARALIASESDIAARSLIACLKNSPCGTFDLQYDFAGIKNLDNRITQILINAEIMTFVLRRQDKTLTDDFVTILKESMIGNLNGSLFTTFARIIAPLGKTQEVLHLWGENLSNPQMVNIRLAREVEACTLGENSRAYVEIIIKKLKSSISDR